MTDLELAARALDVNAANLELGHEVFEAAGATFVRDRRIPEIYDANHVRDITASSPAAIEELIRCAQAEYGGSSRIFHADFRTPRAFEARMVLDDYTRTDTLVMLLEGNLRGDARPCEIRPIEDEVGWEAFATLARIDWGEYATRRTEGGASSVGEHLTLANRWKSPAVRFWLAYADGEARGYFNSWEGIDGTGQVENLFVHPDWRRRGIATALIHHCVADARASGAGPVVIAADPTDTPKQMYARMGWRPLAIKRGYQRAVAA